MLIFISPLHPPHPQLSSSHQGQGPLDLAKGETFWSEGGRVQYMQLVWYLGNIRPAGVSAGMPFIPQHINALFTASSKQQFHLDFEAQVCLVFQ